MKDQSIWHHFDYYTLLGVLALAGVGLLVLSSGITIPYAPAHDPLYFVKRQMMWDVLGLIVLFVVVWIPYPRLSDFAPYIYGLSVLLLGVVMIHGHTALGAQRWIGVGSIQIQPSEIAKVALVITLATHLSRVRSLTRWRDLFLPLVHIGIPFLLILKQPDLGTALVFVAISFAVLLTAGFPVWRLVLLYGGGLGIIVLWIYLHFRFHIPIPMQTYQLDRLLVFLDPNKYASSTGYNVVQSRIAVGTGGLFGLGILGTHHSQLAYLPESYTDFVYAVIGDEFGFVGSMALMGLFFLVIVRAAQTAILSEDRLGSMMAAGVAAMLAFHVIESAGMATGVMPVAGVPLPFISYGGSAVLADAAALGLVINVRMRHHHTMFGSQATGSKSLPALGAGHGDFHVRA